MKKLLATLCLLALPAAAGSVVLTWDAQPGLSFKVWHGTTLVKTVKGNQATVTLPDDGLSTVRVTAFNPAGYGESAPAEITLVPWVIERTSDLRSWTIRKVLYEELDVRAFYRVRIPAL